MKKLNKLFAILIAVLGVGTLSAQTDVTNTYLTNAGFDDNSSWITGNVAQATTKAAKGWTATSSGDTWWYGGAVNYGSSLTVNSVTPPAKNPEGNADGGALGISAGWGCTVTYKQEVTLPAGVYTLSYKAYNANPGATQANNYIGFTSSAVTAYGKTTNFTANTWVEESVIFVLSSQTTGNISVGMGAISGGSGSNAKLFVDGVTLSYKPFTDVTEANPVDLTSMISNTQGAWTGASEMANYDGISMPAVWKGSNWTGDALSQTITGLPAGKYNLEAYCHAHSAWITDVAAEGATGYTYLCANEYKLDVAIRNSEGAGTKTLHKFEGIEINNGTLKISVTNEKLGANWLSIYVKSFTFLGPDKSLEEANFNNNVTALKALSTENLPAAFVTKINNLITTYGNANASAMTLSELVAANEEIKSVIDLHPTITTAFSSLINLRQLCNTYASNSYSNVQDEAQRTTLTTAATTASTDGNNATTVAELTEVYNTLETARQTFVLAAYPTSGNSFDMTFKITNPSFETGDLTGWTIVQQSSDTGVRSNSNGSYTTSGVDGDYLFNTWWQGVPIKQTLAELPTGTYTLTVAVASDGGTIYLTADDEHSAGQMTSDKTVFIDTSIEFLCTDGETTIGVVGGADGDKAAHKDFTENGYWWYKADNFRLTRAFDASTLQSSLSALKTTAANLLTKPMEPSKKSNLQTANNNADTTSDNPFNLGTWAAALETAIAEAQSSVNDYSKIQEYINKTKVFVDASEVATYQTKHDNCQYNADDVETVRRELNIMRYEAASTVFPNPYEVKGWTGDLANVMRSDQHWSGQTIQYYDANSWTANFVGLKHTLSTTVTLPEGTYVLKAAGRSSADATLRLNIKNGETLLESVEYTGKGDTGYGIDTKGDANFSADGTYANGNAGRGWEWEFAKFELYEETTVTLHVEVDYNSIQNRFGSFSDITLWMDDDTYVTVYGKELDAPLAEAKALVNTLPMGEVENTALENAIATGEGKLSGPTELNAAVKGLKDAVAAANTWRETYYSKKPALVAALERFEADYNDAENGALGYMKTSLWTDVIEKVKAAALAKDDRTSHEGLTTATNALNAALDAAQASIDAYAALKTEINSAKNYTPIVAENTSEHSNDLNEAESGYNNATIETGRANELTAALQNYRVLDYNDVVENYGIVELTGEWTGKTNVNHGEHWSGDAEATYFDYSRWSEAGVYEATKTVSLPAGEYVLMAAGRAADVEGTEAYIKVNDVKAIFPTKSSYGRGIATNGTATFADDATYARDNVGYGWEYRFIAFTLAEEAEVTLVAGMNISDSWEPLAWAGVCTPVLYTTPLTAAKENLQKAISEAQTVLNSYPVGNGAFQVDANCDAYQGLSSAISTAQGVLNSSIVVDELVAAIEPLNTAVENYKNGYVLNAPEEGVAYNIVMSAGWEYDGKAVTYIANDRGDHGLYNIKYHAAPNANYAQAFTFTAVEGQANCYTLSMTDVDGNERYVCTGVVYGGNTSQIRTTTEADKALAVKVIATTTDGIHQLYNTEANNYIGGQDAGFYTVNSHTTFRLQEAAKANVTLTLSSVGWATLILPFDAELPEGVIAYSCSEADKNAVEDQLTLVKAESIKANTPYLMNGNPRSYDFSGYGLADKDSYTDGLFVGTYVDYKTTANSNTYVLQNIGGDAAFYLVGDTGQPTVKPYRCYMVYESAAGAPRFSFGRGQGTTSIDNSQFTIDNEVVIYDIMGRKVNTMEKGGMYIVNGKKVIVK